MNMTELRLLAGERNIRGYSRPRKADLINLLCENLRVSSNVTWDPEARSVAQPRALGEAL